MSSETEKVFEIRESAIHGRGAFALRAIQPEQKVAEYLGELIDKTESNKRCELNNEYIFTLDEQWDIDGNVSWNPARFINHSCEPNCEAVIEDGRIWIVAIRAIAMDEEITFNYGFDLESYRDYPCRCGTQACVGYIVAAEFFEHVRNNIRATQGS